MKKNPSKSKGKQVSRHIQLTCVCLNILYMLKYSSYFLDESSQIIKLICQIFRLGRVKGFLAVFWVGEKHHFSGKELNNHTVNGGKV